MAATRHGCGCGRGPEIDFADVDTLDYADREDIAVALGKDRVAALQDADGVVACHSACKTAMEAAFQVDPQLAVALVSPLALRADSLSYALRAAF